MIRKMVVGAFMVMAVAAVSSQPAEAGVGGCGPYCGGKLSGKVSNGSVVLDALKGAVRADILAYFKSLAEANKADKRPIQGGTQTDSGLGGCSPLFGVGGCKL